MSATLGELVEAAKFIRDTDPGLYCTCYSRGKGNCGWERFVTALANCEANK